MSGAAETAAHLIDAVLPHVPLRQFVLVMSFDLHPLLGRDPALEARVLAAFVEELTAYLRKVTGVADGVPGTVTFHHDPRRGSAAGGRLGGAWSFALWRGRSHPFDTAAAGAQFSYPQPPSPGAIDISPRSDHE